ncbi:MAG: zf-HC2 domain-containing protein [Bacteroidota bacterium]
MNCKKVHSKLIFFLDKELPAGEMKQVQEHINECAECALFYDEMKKTLDVLEVDKKVDENPFFYTRVKARLEKEEAAPEKAGRPVLARVLQPVMFSVILLLGIYGGFKMGETGSKDFSDNTLAEYEMVPYLNEMDAEPLEAFLME